MSKSPYSLPNAHLDESQTDLWRHLSLKSPDIPKTDRYPLSSRMSKENIRFGSSKFFSGKSPGLSDRSNYSERANTECPEIGKIKSQLQLKYEQVKVRERQLVTLELDLEKRINSFEEEKEKWCIHISLKLKDIETREEMLVLNEEKHRVEQEALFRSETKVAHFKEKLKEFEKSLEEREEKIRINEEKFEMKIEDLAGYERKVVEFEENLRIKEEDLEKIAELIEEKKKDIEKTAEMFERIHQQLKLEENYLESQKIIQVSKQKALNHEKSALQEFERTLIYRQNELKKGQSFFGSFENFCDQSLSGSSEESEDGISYNIRTPE